MSTSQNDQWSAAVSSEFTDCLKRQREAWLANPVPDYSQRVSDLMALSRLLKENQDALVAAVNADYGNRSAFETRLIEIFGVLEEIRFTIKRLKKWMKPQRRKIDFILYPTSSNRVIPQPLGVVGVIVPWNFPIMLSFSPLTAILAAGNCAMLKMSENSGRLAQLLISITPGYFPPEKVQFFEGGSGRGQAFSRLPFDHLFFTGSAETGRAVMSAASGSLTPVTLELGGKSPAVVAPDFSIETAAGRIMWAKALNAGQICTNVDYLFLPEGREEAFSREALRVISGRYPDINHQDYTSVIDDRSYRRLQATLDDAMAKGARTVNLFPGQTPDTSLRKFPLTLVFNVSEEMEIMKREIFGPLLPVKIYKDADEVIRFVNGHDRPLAFYPFTSDRKLQDYYIARILSGGVTVNNAMLHVGQHDIPFGGIGASGMGHYHGFEGFQTFSKLRPVFYQGGFNSIKMFLPPYDKGPNRIIRLLIKLKG